MEENTSFNYLAWGMDNIAYGPVELPGLVNWIKSGKVKANSWVFRERDSVWSRASDLTELKVLFKSKLPQSTVDAADALGIQPGSLRRIKMLAEAPALSAPFMFALTRVIAQRVRTLTKRYEDSIHFSRSATAAVAADL